MGRGNGGEFINHALIGWAAERAIFMTCARPHKSNDNAHVEQKNGDIVRRSAFRYPRKPTLPNSPGKSLESDSS